MEHCYKYYDNMGPPVCRWLLLELFTVMSNNYIKCHIVKSPTKASKLIEELQLLIDLHGDGDIELSCSTREIQYHYKYEMTEEEILKKEIYEHKRNKNRR
jgi:hypothetical protein